MTDSPVFSIVTICKNNCNGLKSTYESLVPQTFKNFEWIVVDGGSTDDTLSFLSANTLNANILSGTDSGIYDAMNKGLAKATGEYVLFLNAGDKLSDPDILRTLSTIIKAENPDLIYGDALEENLSYKKARSHERIDWGMFTHHQSIYYARRLIQDMAYDLKYSIAADYDFTRRALKRSKNVHYCPAALCIFQSGGISQKNMKAGRNEEYIIRRNHGVPALTNNLVRSRQIAAAITKKLFPRLYTFLCRV